MHAEKIVISNKILYSEKSFKYFIGYIYCDEIEPLGQTLSKMKGCATFFDKIKHTNFSIKDCYKLIIRFQKEFNGSI